VAKFSFEKKVLVLGEKKVKGSVP